MILCRLEAFSPENRQQIRVRSLCLAETIDTRSLRKSRNLASSPLTLEAGEKGCAVVFRFGAVVFFDVTAIEETAFLRQLEPLLSRPIDPPRTEEVTLKHTEASEERIEGGTIHMPRITLQHLQIVADVLAKSVVLEDYEIKISTRIEELRPVTTSLRDGKVNNRVDRLLLHQIGDTLLDHQEMIGRVEVTDKPDILWDAPYLERFYGRLFDEYEVAERHESLERKLDLISRTAQTTLDVIQTRRSLRVEWYIVGLILFEIFLTLWEKFFGK